MARLLVNPGSAEAWEIQLQAGANRLGRSEENDFVIEHPSVSSAHCEILISETGAWIKDLGSTAGTFVEAELVEQGELRSGQTLHLGEVTMRFESEPSERSSRPERDSSQPLAVAADARVATAPVPGATAFCKVHPRAFARFACPKCGQALCELCVNTRYEAGRARKLCRACGSECEALHVAVSDIKPAVGFYAQLPSAFTYPFRGNGAILLVAGTVFFLVIGFLPIIGLLVTGYLFAYAKRIITSTAASDAKPPDWPDFSDWREDILMPYGQLLALLVVCFGPAFILHLWQPGSEAVAHTTFRIAMVWGFLLAPMGMLALAMFDTVTALNPVALAWSIVRIPLQYLVVATTFELVLGLDVLGERLLGSLLSVPLLPNLLSGFLYLYLVTVGMRILGLLYVATKEKLGWFNR